jgi:pyridoxal phosphate enzyme (YggS family)
VCVQVNVGGEASKSGVAPREVPDLIAALAPLPRLRVRGLMTVPRATVDPVAQRAQFRALRELRDAVSVPGVVLDTLSMGMSDDLESAIAEGATMVRVGRAIFGERA